MCRRSLLPPNLEPAQPLSPSVDRGDSQLLPLWTSAAGPAVQQDFPQRALELRPVSPFPLVRMKFLCLVLMRIPPM